MTQAVEFLESQIDSGRAPAGVVDLTRPADAAYWAALFDATLPELEKSVERVGVNPAAVEQMLSFMREMGVSLFGLH